MNTSGVAWTLALLVAAVAAQTNYTVTPISCSGTGACSLDEISNGVLKPKTNGTCPTDYQESAANTTWCEKPCPAGYNASYITPTMSWRRDGTQVICTQATCPAGYTTCLGNGTLGGVCLPPQVTSLQGTGDLCTAFRGREGRGDGGARSCKYTQTPGNCTDGTAVCTAPAMVSCPTGYQLTPDSSSCIRCPAGMNVSSTAPYTCNGTCPSSLLNGTCYGNCTSGWGRHGKHCFKPCKSGEATVNATTCSTNSSSNQAAKASSKGGNGRGNGGDKGDKGGRGGEYQRDFSLAPVLPTSSRALDKRAPKVLANCPTGMAYCGASKCASNIYSASGCAVYAALTPSVGC